MNKKLMAHIVVGYPSLEISEKSALALIKGGADIIELQIPFSDPSADGPSIVAASHTALKNGAKVKDAFVLAKKLTKNNSVEVVLMTYANIPFRFGFAKFVSEAKKAGVSGIIIPDLPFDSEEGKEFVSECFAKKINPVVVISPGVKEERLKMLKESASGFVYCTSRQGITGATSFFSGDLPDFINNVRKIISLPIAVGFGIASPKDAETIWKIADICVVGSAFLPLISSKEGAKKIVKFTRAICSSKTQ